MAITGKTGADAVFLAVKHICKILVSYGSKLDKFIDDSVTNGTITSGQATQAKLFLQSATVACDIFLLLAQASNVN